MPRGTTHEPEVVKRALDLLEAGLSRADVARRLNVSRFTVGGWARGDVPKGAVDAAHHPRCPTCGAGSHALAPGVEAAYVYLLGLYLGDGCVTSDARATSLRITLDAAYPGIIAECRAAILRVQPERTAHAAKRRDSDCVVVTSWGRCWLCRFPQHGPGRKHQRAIRLTSWQQRLADRHAEALIRGLIHSDGWRGTNRVVVKGKAYAYPRYQFSNRSDDIRGIFTAACDRLGIPWRPWGRWHISVAQRVAVSRMDEFVGLKR